MTTNNVLDEYYECQRKVPRFGTAGQKILQEAKCLIVGMGGLGCPLAQYLAASGVGMLGLVDSDIVEFSSLNRQILYTPEDIGNKKIEVANARLAAQNPYITIEPYDERINEENWQKILPNYDIIVDCTDNFSSKFLIHDACYILKKDLVQAGIYQTSGQVYYFNFSQKQREFSPSTNTIAVEARGCLRCIWQDAPNIGYQSSCSVAGVLASVAGTVALMQANTALLALLQKADKLASSMQIFDWETLEWTRLRMPLNPECACSTKETFASVTNYLYTVQAVEIHELSSSNDGYTILDVRNEKDQLEHNAFGNRTVQRLKKLELLNFNNFIQSLDTNTHYILVCYRGNRSLMLTNQIRKRGRSNVQSLVGGYLGLQSKQKSLRKQQKIKG